MSLGLSGSALVRVQAPFCACLAAGVKPLLLVTSQYAAACALCSSVLESDLKVPFGLRSLVCLGFCKPGLIPLLIPQVKPSCVASAVLAPVFLPGLHPFFVLVPMSIGVEHWVLSWSTPPTVVRRGLSGHPGLVAFNAPLPALGHADWVLGWRAASATARARHHQLPCTALLLSSLVALSSPSCFRREPFAKFIIIMI